MTNLKEFFKESGNFINMILLVGMLSAGMTFIDDIATKSYIAQEIIDLQLSQANKELSAIIIRQELGQVLDRFQKAEIVSLRATITELMAQKEELIREK